VIRDPFWRSTRHRLGRALLAPVRRRFSRLDCHREEQTCATRRSRSVRKRRGKPCAARQGRQPAELTHRFFSYLRDRRG